MKKILFFTLLVFISGSNIFSDDLDSLLNSNDASKLADPAWAFYNNGHYDKALLVFKRIIELEPENGWAHYGCGVQLSTMNKYEEALPFLKKAESLGTHPYFYAWLGYTYQKLDDSNKAIINYEKSLDHYLEIKLKPFKWNVDSILNLYFETAEFDKSRKLVGNLKNYGFTENEAREISKSYNFYFKALDYWKENYEKLKSTAYNHKVLIIILTDIEISKEWGNKKSETIINSVNGDFVEKHKAPLDLLTMAYFYYTKGGMLFSYDVTSLSKPVKIKISKSGRFTGEKGFFSGSSLNWDTINALFDSTYPELGDIYFQNRNRYDSFIRIYVPRGFDADLQNYGWSGPLPYLYNKDISNIRRGILTMNSANWNADILIHEFFHACEWAFNDVYFKKGFIMHQYRNDNKNKWPPWYKGEGEQIYYERIFDKIFRINGIERLNFRKEEEKLTLDQFMKGKESITK